MIPRGFALPLWGLARCADLPQGYARQHDGNGGVQVAAAWRWLMDQVDKMDKMDKMGAPRDNPRVGGAAVWNGSGEDVPQG